MDEKDKKYPSIWERIVTGCTETVRKLSRLHKSPQSSQKTEPIDERDSHPPSSATPESTPSPISQEDMEAALKLTEDRNNAENQGGNLRDLVIGFDLGTSCSKVVIQDETYPMAWGVPFPLTGHESNPYLQPTVVYIQDNGQVSLAPKKNSRKCGNLKLLLLDNPQYCIFSNDHDGHRGTIKELLACYIALVLKQTRSWFVESNQTLYQNDTLEWQMNLGLPAHNYDDKKLRSMFEAVARIGWHLSEQTDPITLEDARKAFTDIASGDFHLGIDPEYIQVYPEVAAEVAGYARSRLRNPGLHLLIDIGAGTLDLSTFELNAQSMSSDDKYSFLATAVERLGCFELHKRRLAEVQRIIEGDSQETAELGDPVQIIPDSLDSYLPSDGHSKDIIQQRLTASDQNHLVECVKAVAKIVRYTKGRKDPLSRTWKEGLPVILCGGGSKMALYRSIPESVEDILRHHTSWNGFRVIDLPAPEHFVADELGPDDYHRMAVAYGLSFSYGAIGEVVPPSDIEDIRPEVRKRATYPAPVSKDMV